MSTGAHSGDVAAAAIRRRRAVVAATLVGGAVVLGMSFAVRPGDPSFYLLTLVLAGTWTIGGLLSGPLRLGRLSLLGRLRRPVLTPVLTGLVASAVFVGGALFVREIPLLSGFVDDVLAHAHQGSLALIAAITVVNAVAEEIFFRGALYTALGGAYPVLLSTAVYTLATAATANPMLVFASAVLGLVLAVQRRASAGILAPILTHVTWSVTMLLTLPPLFGS
ncbi:CPBP family intramembrane glutamic endopeptidase [Longispora sp. NPDC051575]|uniref:CPBP family intramembrane glutamic endopeptidase n=1 Tax=Longispora sp. NPDC051575 TaxID=3154943 RepID=UPI00342EC453